MLSMMLSNNKCLNSESPKNVGWGGVCYLQNKKSLVDYDFSLMSLNEKLPGWFFANNQCLQIFRGIVGDLCNSSNIFHVYLLSIVVYKKYTVSC